MHAHTMRTRQNECCQGRNKPPGAPSTFACLAAAALVSTSATASDDYDYAVMARTGQDGLTGIKSAPSINNHGSVAFGGNLATGESLSFSSGHGAKNVAPGFVGTTFSTYLQLADDATIVARDGTGTDSSRPMMARLERGEVFLRFRLGLPSSSRLAVGDLRLRLATAGRAAGWKPALHWRHHSTAVPGYFGMTVSGERILPARTFAVARMKRSAGSL